MVSAVAPFQFPRKQVSCAVLPRQGSLSSDVSNLDAKPKYQDMLTTATYKY